MGLWTWKAFITDGGRNIYDEWIDGQSDSVIAEFITTLQYLDVRKRPEWSRPFFSQLTGGKKNKKTGCNGLSEIRFKANNVQQRPLGDFNGHMEYVILIFAIEKDSAFKPPTACETAKKRKALILQNKDRADVIDFEKGY